MAMLSLEKHEYRDIDDRKNAEQQQLGGTVPPSAGNFADEVINANAKSVVKLIAI